MPWILKNGEDSQEMLLPSRLSTNDADVYVDSAVNGYGVALIARVMAQPYLDSGRLVELLPEWREDDMPISAMYPQNRHLSAKVRVFVDWAAELFARHPELADVRRLAA
jgi:LysR family transcriptional regulator for bpeEF and oprC